jgi:hypothetical protein
MATATAVVVWTYSRLIALLESNRAALERAILTLNARQTADERATLVSRHENGRGWNQRDASFGGSLAEWIERGVAPRSEGGFGKAPGTCLTPTQREGALRLVQKYWKQLLEEIAQKGGEVDYKAATPKQAKRIPPAGATAQGSRYGYDEEGRLTPRESEGLTAAEEEGFDTPEHRPPNGWFSRDEVAEPEF